MGRIWNSTLMRRTPLKKFNRKRIYRRRHDQDGHKHTFGPFYDWAVSSLPCGFLLRGNHRCWRGMIGHHVKSRATGGRDRLENGDGNVFPCCEGAHTEIHQSTKEEIWMRYQIDLKAEAKRIGKPWRRRQ